MKALIIGTLTSMLSRAILRPEFLEWAIRFAARKLVEHTKTPHDDEFLNKIEEMLDSAKS